MSNEVPFPRRARVQWPAEFGPHVRLLAEKFVLTEELADAIAEAIEKAHRRGVEVRILTDDDKSADRGSDAGRLAARGIPLRVDRSPGHMHHKFAISDRRILLNGSYNWTRSACTSNNENIAITNHKPLVQQFEKEFLRLWKHLR